MFWALTMRAMCTLPLDAAADVFLGDGAGGLALSSAIGLNASSTATSWSVSLLLADFNGDGRLDLAVTVKSYDITGESGFVALGNGDGTFGPAAPPSATTPQSSLAGDFNGDNRLDVARLGSVQLSNGDGSFQPPRTYESPAGACFRRQGISTATAERTS